MVIGKTPHIKVSNQLYKSSNQINRVNPRYIISLYLTALFIHKGYGLACVIDIMCNTLSGIGAGFLTGGGGLLFQAYDIESFCDKDVNI